jgi:hypothetical protein
MNRIAAIGSGRRDGMALGFVRLDQRRQHVDVIAFRGSGLGRPQPFDLVQRRAMIGLVSDRGDLHGDPLPPPRCSGG